MQRSGQYLPLNDTTGINILGSLVEPSQESPHPEYYGALHNYGHILLGQITDPKGKFNVRITSFPQIILGRTGQLDCVQCRAFVLAVLNLRVLLPES
jgi:hypothetical protein